MREIACGTPLPRTTGCARQRSAFNERHCQGVAGFQTSLRQPLALDHREEFGELVVQLACLGFVPNAGPPLLIA